MVTVVKKYFSYKNVTYNNIVEYMEDKEIN